MALPNFTADQRRELRRLGVSDQQVEELRAAALSIKLALYPAAARNDVLALLNRVEATSQELIRALTSLAQGIDSAHATASALVEEQYWSVDRFEDDGPTAAHHLIPRLTALANAAKSGKTTLPSRPVRHRVGDWRPIKAIKSALLHGWVKAHGPFAYSVAEGEDVGDMIAHAKRHPPAEPYPKRFDASSSPNSTFRRIVGICYAMAGARNPDPERAIKAYLAHERKARAAVMEAIERAWAKPESDREGESE